MSGPPDDSELALACAVAARRWSTPCGVQYVGQGSNNTIWRASGPGEDVVIKLSRPHREDGALGEYRKEAWCAAEARKKNVPTPPVLDFGLCDGRAFAILGFVDGTAPAPEQAAAVWRELGGMTRRIHTIATEGWGGRLSADGRFEESWQAHLDYNIAALTPQDELLGREVLDSAGAQRLRHALEHLARKQFRFGLCHGDIALWNVSIDKDGTPWLLDWGCAVSHVVPHYEINEIVRTAQPAAEQFEAFLDGYGISHAAHAAMEPDLLALAALREVDTLRWAIDRNPDAIAELTMRSRAAVAKLA